MSSEKEEPDQTEPLPTMLPHRETGARQVSEKKPVQPNLDEKVLAHLADELKKELEDNDFGDLDS